VKVLGGTAFTPGGFVAMQHDNLIDENNFFLLLYNHRTWPEIWNWIVISFLKYSMEVGQHILSSIC